MIRGGRRRKAAIETAASLATVARGRFVRRMTAYLETFAGDANAAQNVLVMLEKYFHQQTLAYMQRPQATSSAWQEHGPELELAKVRDAVNGITKWDDLLATYRKSGTSSAFRGGS